MPLESADKKVHLRGKQRGAEKRDKYFRFHYSLAIAKANQETFSVQKKSLIVILGGMSINEIELFTIIAMVIMRDFNSMEGSYIKLINLQRKPTQKFRYVFQVIKHFIIFFKIKVITK